MSDDGSDFSALAVVSGGAAVVDIRQATGKQAELDRLRSRVLVLRDEMGEAYFELGRLLHRINRDALYVNWNGPEGKPYKSFYDYVEYEVDFAFRKAKYLMSIWWWFAEELGDKDVMEKVKQIGWTKAALLVGVVDGKNVDLWIGKAKASNVKELREKTRSALEVARKRRPDRGAESPSQDTGVRDLPLPMPAAAHPESMESSMLISKRIGVDPLTQQEEDEHPSLWAVKLRGDQRVNVEMAIDVAHHIAETEKDSKGHLLDLIATAFLALRGGTVGENDRRDKVNFRHTLLTLTERSLGVDLIAIDRATNKPLYGFDAIERMAKLGDDNAGQS
jgi:hypothetical protein